jgi:hypothetical protein
MSAALPSRSPYGVTFRQFAGIITLFLLSATALYGDIPATLQASRSTGCACRCHDGQMRRGCIKICDKERQAQWLTTSCMKPRFQRQDDKAHAGPHLKHPDRAEHAQLRN